MGLARMLNNIEQFNMCEIGDSEVTDNGVEYVFKEIIGNNFL